MSKKHYEAVAAAIREELTEARAVEDRDGAAVAGRLARSMAGIFAADNSRFDRARFLSACGLS